MVNATLEWRWLGTRVCITPICEGLPQKVRQSAGATRESFKGFALPVNAPPFLVSFCTPKQFLEALPDDVRKKFGKEIARLVRKRLPPVVSARCLATLFGYNPKFIGAIYEQPERYYRTFSIKKGKKERTIRAPKVALKVIQKWFGCHLANAVKLDKHVFGFVKGRSAAQAASQHCGATWVYSVDIADFFPSTPMSKVVAALQGLGYPDRGAELIAKLCCYNAMLSQGSPASPVLSNLIFRQADAELNALAKAFRLRFSRYADDIVFSSSGEFPVKLKSQVRGIIKSHGWQLAEKKELLSQLPGRLKVHGLLVHGKKPRLTRGYRNRIRGFAHMLKEGKVAEADMAKLRGHVSYAQSVERTR